VLCSPLQKAFAKNEFLLLCPIVKELKSCDQQRLLLVHPIEGLAPHSAYCLYATTHFREGYIYIYIYIYLTGQENTSVVPLLLWNVNLITHLHYFDRYIWTSTWGKFTVHSSHMLPPTNKCTSDIGQFSLHPRSGYFLTVLQKSCHADTYTW
jgi:hypothetical protein